MKLHILSDLHIEFEDFEPPDVDADVVILAGDIHVKGRGLAWAMRAFPDRPVLYVLGNHEYYRKAIPKHLQALREQADGSNVRILEQDAFVSQGVEFLGCTLWTDFRLFGDPRVAGYEATRKMTDFRLIRVSPVYRKFRSLDAANTHRASLEWLKSRTKNSSRRYQVVITHHAPSRRSIPEEFTSDILSAAYASDLDEFVERSGVCLWVHGHLHNQSDYHIGSTRVLCNPRGYPGERNPEFVADLTVTLNA